MFSADDPAKSKIMIKGVKSDRRGYAGDISCFIENILLQSVPRGNFIFLVEFPYAVECDYSSCLAYRGKIPVRNAH